MGKGLSGLKLHLWQQERGRARSGCRREGKWELDTMEGMSGMR